MITLLSPVYGVASYESYKEKKMIEEAAEEFIRKNEAQERRYEKRYREETGRKGGSGDLSLCYLTIGIIVVFGFFAFRGQVLMGKTIDRAISKGFSASQYDKKCKKCAEFIKVEAKVCKYCGEKFNSVDIKNAVHAVAKEYLSSNPLEGASDGRDFFINRKFERQVLNTVRKEALSLYRSGKNKKAIAVFNKLVALQPRDGQLYYHRAFAYNKIGERQKAVVDLKRAAKLGYHKALDRLAKRS